MTQDTNKGSNILDILFVIIKKRRLIIIMTISLSILSLLFTFIGKMLPPEISYDPDVYKAVGYVLMNDAMSNSNSLGAISNIANLAGISMDTGGGYANLVVELAESNPIIDKIAQTHGFYDSTVKFPLTKSRADLRKRIELEYSSDTGIISISCKHMDGKKAQEVVNTLIDLLDKRFANIGKNRNLTEISLLESKISEVTAQMKVLEQKIKDFQTKNEVLTVDQLASEQITANAQARSQLIIKDLEISTARQFSNENDPSLQRLIAERNNLIRVIDELSRGVGVTGRPGRGKLPELALEFSTMQRDLLIQTEIYKILIQQYESKKLLINGEGPIFQILELAEAPEAKNSPDRFRFVLMFSLVGFFVSIFTSLLINYLSNINKELNITEKLKKELLYKHNKD